MLELAYRTRFRAENGVQAKTGFTLETRSIERAFTQHDIAYLAPSALNS